MASPTMDPHTAYVDYTFDYLSPDDDWAVERVYYWFDPESPLPAVDDEEFRLRFPEISDDRWRSLFCEAFERGQRLREAEMRRRGESEESVQTWGGIARLFGPRGIRIHVDDDPGGV